MILLLKDMIPHVQRALVDGEISLPGISPPLLFQGVAMSEDYAVKSGPVFFDRILQKFVDRRESSMGVFLVQHTIENWKSVPAFISEVNRSLKLGIEETQTNYDHLEVT